MALVFDPFSLSMVASGGPVSSRENLCKKTINNPFLEFTVKMSMKRIFKFYHSVFQEIQTNVILNIHPLKVLKRAFSSSDVFLKYLISALYHESNSKLKFL